MSATATSRRRCRIGFVAGQRRVEGRARAVRELLRAVHGPVTDGVALRQLDQLARRHRQRGRSRRLRRSSAPKPSTSATESWPTGCRTSLTEIGWAPVDLPPANRSTIVSVPTGRPRPRPPAGRAEAARRRLCRSRRQSALSPSTSTTTRTTSTGSRPCSASSDVASRQAPHAANVGGCCWPALNTWNLLVWFHHPTVVQVSVERSKQFTVWTWYVGDGTVGVDALARRRVGRRVSSLAEPLRALRQRRRSGCPGPRARAVRGVHRLGCRRAPGDHQHQNGTDDEPSHGRLLPLRLRRVVIVALRRVDHDAADPDRPDLRLSAPRPGWPHRARTRASPAGLGPGRPAW